MSVSSDIPGYCGYAQNFQKQFVTGKDVPSKKYEDFDEGKRNYMTDSQYLSNYATTINPSRTMPRHPEIADSLPNRNFTAFDKYRDDIIQKREANEYEVRPTYWATTYQSTMNGWKEAGKTREQMSRSTNLYTTARSGLQVRAMNEGGGTNSVKGGVVNAKEVNSSYQMCYGKAGEGPMDRYFPADGTSGFSRRATTNDLFHGTTKASSRLPNYAGFVPASVNNINTVRNNVHYEIKDNLIQNYAHNIPNYTGHRPMAVVNDHGPRNPEGKCPLPVGRYTGMQLESMKYS